MKSDRDERIPVCMQEFFFRTPLVNAQAKLLKMRGRCPDACADPCASVYYVVF